MMTLDRRRFLSFVLGGAAGTALSPLPWKLTDDLAIWTQNWPWTPVPAKGEVSYLNSTCTLCPGGCGITVRRVDQRVVKIEGRPGHPVNDGGLCTLGLAAAQLLYGPARVTAPLKKVNGNWRTISWDAAMAEVVARLRDLRTRGLAHTLACISETDRGTVAELLNRFLTVYGSPNFIRTPSLQDAYELTLYLTQGVRAMAGFDLAAADFILSFGSGLIEGWGSPVYMLRAKSALLDRDGRMQQVETRLSKTAAKADRWIAITPGSEGALALGLAHVIIAENLYNRDFVTAQTSGFGAFQRAVVDGYPPDRVAAITGVDRATITTLAREFARATKPVAIGGRGAGHTPGSLQECLAIHSLNALVGAINRPGGVWAVPEPDYIHWPEPEMDAIAANAQQTPRLDGAGSDEFPLARYLLNRLPEAIAAEPASAIEMLWVVGANPLYTLADSTAVAKAFEKIPFVVSFSAFMDETAAQADLILPNHVFLERWEDVPAARGFPQSIIGLVRPVSEPLFDTRATGDVIIQMAQACGGPIAAAFPWDSYRQCLEQTLAQKWDVLVENGYWIDATGGAAGSSAVFETESGKFEFSNAEIASLPPYAVVRAGGDETIYPLILIAYDSMRLAGGPIGSPPFLVKSLEDFILRATDGYVEINPATARAYGLTDGQAAVLRTPKGNGRVRIHYREGIMPGVIAMPRGLGHSAHDKFLAGKGLNANALMGAVEDPASGFDAAWGIRAHLSKA